MKLTKFILSVLFLSTYLFSFSQIEIPKTINIKFDIKKDRIQIIRLGEKGILTLHKTNSKEKGKIQWIVTQYDKNLDEVWSSTALIPKKLSVSQKYFNEETGDYYIFFSAKSERNGMEYVGGKNMVLTVNLSKQKVIMKESSLKGSYVINDFIVENNTAFLFGAKIPSSGSIMAQMCCSCTCIPLATGLSMIHTHAVIHKIDLSTGKNNMEALDLPKSSSIQNANLIDNNIYTFVLDKPKTKILVAYEYKLDTKGKQLKKIKIKPKRNKVPINGQLSKIDDNESILIGSYIKDFKPSFGDRFFAKDNILQLPSSGIYFSKFINDKQSFISYYKIKDFGILNTKKTKNKGVDKGAYLIDIHKIKKIDENFIFVAEAYYPTYYYEVESYFDAQGNYSTRTVRRFDGYDYTHAIVASINQDGNINWTQVFPLSVDKSWVLEKHVEIKESDDIDDINITFPYENRLKTVSISNGEIINQSSVILNTTGKDDDDYLNNVNHWYDDVYISYGIEHYKKANGKEKKNDGFYSISKIVIF